MRNVMNGHVGRDRTGTDKNSDFKSVISNPHMRVFQNGSLAVNNVQRNDAASFLCQVSNGIGPGLSKVVTLTVNGETLSIPDNQFIP